MAVQIIGPDGKEIARGLVNYNSAEIESLKGKQSTEFVATLGRQPSSDEIVSRDNLALLMQGKLAGVQSPPAVPAVPATAVVEAVSLQDSSA